MKDTSKRGLRIASRVAVAAAVFVPLAATDDTPAYAGTACNNSHHTHKMGLDIHYVRTVWPYSSEWKWQWKYYNQITGANGNQGTVVCPSYPPPPCPCSSG